jgi:hypothetical protein
MEETAVELSWNSIDGDQTLSTKFEAPQRNQSETYPNSECLGEKNLAFHG